MKHMVVRLVYPGGKTIVIEREAPDSAENAVTDVGFYVQYVDVFDSREEAWKFFMDEKIKVILDTERSQDASSSGSTEIPRRNHPNGSKNGSEETS